MRSHRLVPALIATAIFIGGDMAAAQSQPVQHQWEIEVHGGGIWAAGGTDGTTALPPAGPSIAAPPDPYRRAELCRRGCSAMARRS